MHGGVLQGVQLDPVSCIMSRLPLRFAQLDDERRLVAMAQLLAFTRNRTANINATLARYDVVRARAARIGNFAMSFEGCALQILRACSVNESQLIQFLTPFGGRLPNTEQ